jgi:hypothetical protein
VVGLAFFASLKTNYYKLSKYDILGRIIQTGIIFGIGGFSRSQLQKDFDDFADVSTNIIYEERGTDLEGYTNRSFPANYTPQNSNLRTVTYYDDYGWNTDVNFNFDVAHAFHSQGLTKGLMTGKLKRNLRTGTWQKSLLYYDYQGRVIQDWHLTNRGNLIRKDLQYRFNGELLKTRIEKKNGSTILSSKIITYEYDHLSRKIKYKYLLDGNERTLAKYDYDHIGRMKTKAYSPSTPTGSKQTGAWLDNATWLTGSYPTLSDQVTINAGHTVTIPAGNFVSAGMLNDNGILQNNGTLNLGNVSPSTTALQSILYSHHIRGGLKGINLDASGNLTNNIFSYKLDYENGTNGYFDGNISKQSWQSNIDGKERDFTYTYDGASRLKSGAYNSTLAGENYALNNVSYDDNGNILNLSRNGLKSDNNFGLIDNLNYTYNTNSNKILNVDDASTETASFRDVVGDDYTYWQDGSLRSDNNKEITNISYNYLKLPEEITLTGGRWIRYDYDADGIKLKKTLSTGKYTDYEEDDIYEDGILYQTSNDEGRIVNDVYEYDIKDHLGNTRVSFRDNNGNAQITQVNHGGAFGESLESLSYVNTPKINNFTISTYEKENDFGISVFDAHARVFDPIVPRMWQQDRVSESFAHLSLYNFNANNPIVNVDASGDSTSYFNTYGELLYTSFDQLENAITIIPEENIEEFMKALNSYIERQRTSQYKKNKKNEDNRINAVLRGYYGTSYMIDGFKKFFNLNKNDTKWNRQFGQKTHLEHGSFLYKSNNTIRIGNENISGGLGAVIFGDTPENAVGRLHTHDDLNIYEEHPSEYDRNNHSSGAGTYNVVIGPQNIYFYSNQPKLMNFNISKNNSFKK